MKNFQKYNREIMNAGMNFSVNAETMEVIPCRSACGECLFDNTCYQNCIKERLEWLDAEYIGKFTESEMVFLRFVAGGYIYHNDGQAYYERPGRSRVVNISKHFGLEFNALHEEEVLDIKEHLDMLKTRKHK